MQVSTTLPESAEPKMIDIWMCTHVAILFLIFFVHIIVNAVKERYEDEQEIKGHRTYNIGRKWTTMKSVMDLVSL